MILIHGENGLKKVDEIQYGQVESTTLRTEQANAQIEIGNDGTDYSTREKDLGVMTSS